MPDSSPVPLQDRRSTLAVGAAALALLALQLYFGARPGLGLPAGDFANYYTTAHVAISGEDLTPAYSDPIWFQQRIEATGLAGQLGGFAPHPPATALVMTPLASLSPLRAKQVWTLVNVAIAIACVAALAWLGHIGLAAAAVALLGSGIALANDLALGQLYLPLLLSLAVGLALVERERTFAGGLALGLLVPVKPFAVPLLLYFALRREWRVIAGALVSAGGVTVASVWVLGWSAHREYLSVVLPAQMSGMLQDPYHPLWQSLQSLARRMFVYDPVWNAAPVANLPSLASFAPTAVAVLVWGAVVVLVRCAPDRRRLHFAAIVAATLAVAPGGASYHLVLLSLVYALLSGELSWRNAPRLAMAGLGVAVLLALPLPSLLRRFDGGWSTPIAYPRLWLLLALTGVTLVALARQASKLPSIRSAIAIGALAVVAGAVSAVGVLGTAADNAHAVPVAAAELTGPDRAPLFRPEMLGSELTFLAPVRASGRYARFAVDRKIGPDALGEPRLSALSLDRQLLAFTRNGDIWVRLLATGDERQITRSPSIDREPCWRDATHLVFASDRGSGLGYTALYEIEVTE